MDFVRVYSDYVNSTILLQQSVNNRRVHARYLQSLRLKRMYITCKINILPKLYLVFLTFIRFDLRHGIYTHRGLQ